MEASGGPAPPARQKRALETATAACRRSGVRTCVFLLPLVLVLCGAVQAAAEAPATPQANTKVLLNETGCTLREPLYNQTFDFRSLNSDLQHHVEPDDESGERFFFNVCGGDRTGPSGAYVTRPGGNVSLGRDARLLLTDGRIQFRFEGDRCGNGTANATATADVRHSLDIILICRYERNSDALRVLPHSVDSCRYFIFWDTPLACLPLPEPVRNNSCTVRDATGAHEYALMALARENREVAVGTDGSRFVLSACKPVHYTHRQMCPPGSAVCFVNGTEPDVARRYRDFGQVVPNPSLDARGRLVMELRSATERCDDSRIVFECGGPAARGQPEVEYRGRASNCTHEFVWRTELACRNATPCATTNPITGTRYDLGSLAGRTHRVTAPAGSNRTYEVAICRAPPAPGLRCGDDFGACETLHNGTQTVGLGRVSDELRYGTTGAPYLLYRSGADCDPGKGRRWETRLEFICETDRGPGGQALEPHGMVVENGDCLLVVHFETELVCEPALMVCGAHNASAPDQFVDLTPLVRSGGNYEASLGPGLQPTHSYFLNVCRPLVPQYGLSCRGGAAACETVFDGKTHRNETTLGFPDVSLVVAGDTVLMKYFRGDPCPHDPHTNLSAGVTFRCQRAAGSGNPVLMEIEHGCHYRFDWATDVICPPDDGPHPHPPTTPALTTAAPPAPPGVRFEARNCSFYNPATGAWADMNAAFRGVPELGGLCDRSPTACADERALHIHFTDDDAHGPDGCSDPKGKRSYNITLTCGDDGALDRTVPTNCLVIIKKQSPTVCALVGRPLPVPSAGIGPFGVIAICLTVVTAIGATGWYLVWRIPERRRRLYSLLPCRGATRGDFPSTVYSRVDNSEVSSLLLNATMSESDDDMLI